MILLLFGENDFLLVEELKKITEKGKNEASVFIFDLKESTFEEFREVFYAPNIFKKDSIFILKNFDRNDQFKKNLLLQIKEFSVSPQKIILFEPSPIKDKDFLQSIKDYATIKEFKRLNPLELKSWTKKELAQYGVDLNENDIEFLVQFCEQNMWTLKEEIKKVASYYGKGKKVSLKSFEIIGPLVRGNIFQILQQYFLGKKQRAIEMVKNEIEVGEDSFNILQLFKNQTKRLIILKSLAEQRFSTPSIIKRTKLHPFFVQQSMYWLRNVDIKALKAFYKNIFRLEVAIKRGKIETENALYFLLLS